MELSIDIADTPAALAQGLMWVKDMPKESGMLFKFPSATEARFWGKNTYIPLDIAFIDANDRITNIKSITPMSTRMISGDGLTSCAIEANAGFFRECGIKEGYKISVQEDKSGYKVVFSE